MDLLLHPQVERYLKHTSDAARQVLQLPGYAIPAEQIAKMTSADLEGVVIESRTILERLAREEAAALESLQREFHSRVEAVLA